MNSSFLFGTGASLALALIGTAAMGASRDNDQIRGAEWQPERALTQNMPAPRYRTLPLEDERYSQSRYQQNGGRYNGEDMNYRQDQREYDSSANRFRRNQQGQDQYSSRQPNTPVAHRILGTLLRMKGDYFVVNTDNGDQQRLHVSQNTLVDAGLERGDRLIAKVRPDGHAISIMKDRGRRGEHYSQPGAPEGESDSRYNSRIGSGSYQWDYDEQQYDRNRYRP